MQDYQPNLNPAQQAALLLWHLVNLSVPVYNKLVARFGSAEQAIQAKLADWQALGLHDNHHKRFAEFISASRTSQFLHDTLLELSQGQYGVVFHNDPLYPTQLKNIYDPPPLLLYQGNLSALSQPQLQVEVARWSQ